METFTIVTIVAAVGTVIGGIVGKIFVDRVWDFSMNISEKIRGKKRRRTSIQKPIQVENTPVSSLCCCCY
jgi:hypothetical protein